MPRKDAKNNQEKEFPPCTVLQQKRKTGAVILQFPAKIRERFQLKGGMVIMFPPVGYKVNGQIVGGVFAKASPEVELAYRKRHEGQRCCRVCGRWSGIEAVYCQSCGHSDWKTVESLSQRPDLRSERREEKSIEKAAAPSGQA